MSQDNVYDMLKDNSDDTLRPSNPPSSTPETTIREQLYDICLTTVYLDDQQKTARNQSERIIDLWSRLITEARPEELVRTHNPDDIRDLKCAAYNEAIQIYETNLKEKLQ